MARGSGADIATIGVAAIAGYFIYTLIKNNNALLPGEVAGPVYIAGERPSDTIAPVAPAPSGKDILAADQVIGDSNGAALKDIFKSVWTAPPVALAPQHPAPTVVIQKDIGHSLPSLTDATSLFDDAAAAFGGLFP